MDLTEVAASIGEIKRLMADAREDYFNELTERGFSDRGAYLVIYARSGYLRL